MYLIVGLGNPEPEYANTRHNMGFDVINQLCIKSEITMKKNKFNGIYGMGEWQKEKVILLKPQTYMNDSGKCIVQIQHYFKIEHEKTIIVYDDVDLEVSKIRIRAKGSANTHNGMKSVVQCLNTTEFPRVRVGIGLPNKDIREYVLEKLTLEERKNINEGIEKAVLAIEEILKNGIVSAMNRFN